MIFASAKDHVRIYSGEFVKEFRWQKDPSLYPLIQFPSDYKDEPSIRFAPSQGVRNAENEKSIPDEYRKYVRQSEVLTDSYTLSDSGQKKLTSEWIAFLTGGSLPLKEVQSVTMLTQGVFDALCTQDQIESLRIKWLNGKDISKIANLKNLKKLFIERGSRINDITPLTSLSNLEVLILGETNKITDYSCISALKKLKVFSVCAYQSSVVSHVKMISTDFLYDMPSLEYVDIVDVKISK